VAGSDSNDHGRDRTSPHEVVMVVDHLLGSRRADSYLFDARSLPDGFGYG
jgi:hypothetical protein